MIAETIGHYRIAGKLGEGGMGVVWRAYDAKLQREVALKLLPDTSLSDPGAKARLLREARAAASLSHPGICTIHEVGEADGQTYIAMELIEGRTLSASLAEGPLTALEAARYGRQLADALAHAHQRGVIHRDLKSANIIITRDGRARVLDFGLARHTATIAAADSESDTRSTTLTDARVVSGTLAYMAPEQLRGCAADARSDIWSLGVVLHESLTGVLPFRGTTGFEMTSAILTGTPGPLPDGVDAGLRAVIERCLEKNPDLRYQSAAEVRAALEAIESGAGTSRFAAPVAVRPRKLVLAAAAIAALAVVLVLMPAGWRGRLSGSRPARVQSIAVLPLDNLARDDNQQYLVDGIQEALITDLARLGTFRKVISRASVVRYRGGNKPLHQIADELGVDALLAGSVLQSGDQIRITAQLVNAREENLWADRFDRNMRDVLSVQSEIVAAIARGIEARLTSSQHAILAAKRPINPEAYEAYLKGLFHLNKSTPDGISKGIGLLHRAIEIEPAVALPYAGLAMGYATLGHNPSAPPDTMPKAKAAALKALSIDPEQPEALAALAEVKLYWDRDWNWADTENTFKRALEAHPGLAQTHAHYGWLLLLFGRRDEALAQMHKAVELDPLSPLFTTWAAEHYMAAGDFEKGLEWSRKALELNSEFPIGYFDLGGAYFGKRMIPESIVALKKAQQLSPQWGWPLGIVYAATGRRQEAVRFVEQLERDKSSWNTWGISQIYAALGDKQKALDWLERSDELRHPYTPWIRVDPSFRSLVDEPRFRVLLRRMNLPPCDDPACGSPRLP